MVIWTYSISSLLLICEWWVSVTVEGVYMYFPDLWTYARQYQACTEVLSNGYAKQVDVVHNILFLQVFLVPIVWHITLNSPLSKGGHVTILSCVPAACWPLHCIVCFCLLSPEFFSSYIVISNWFFLALGMWQPHCSNCDEYIYCIWGWLKNV